MTVATKNVVSPSVHPALPCAKSPDEKLLDLGASFERETQLNENWKAVAAAIRHVDPVLARNADIQADACVQRIVELALAIQKARPRTRAGVEVQACLARYLMRAALQCPADVDALGWAGEVALLVWKNGEAIYARDAA